ncbi:beta-xylosidase [Chromobacterium violaceum]|uniref:beta-xylosidase n=1 Tax=Chromobacterium violaceum TaxID=536 RepID=UPI0009D99087|nr:beta-xylosidase [Chromobacterium violaceum]OQS09026.1 beta-xylosidase [Chromobacterium violaceum]OQS23921.1 beta-xylosidase [Chromobacterium violaceum]
MNARLLPLALLLCPLLAPGEEIRLQAPRALAWRDFLGVNAHFLWFAPEQYRRQMAMLKKLGLSWVRVDLHWDRHEPRENQWQLAPLDRLAADLQAQRLKSVFYLVGSAPFASSSSSLLPGPSDQFPPRSPQVFASRMALLAKRYPAVSAWQVWNEPNLPAYWRPLPSPEGYGKLLQATVPALRQAAPGKPVVMAGMAYYSQMPVRGGLMLEELGRLGAFGLGAVAAYHPYSRKPEGDEPAAADFVHRAREINRRLRAAHAAGIWATEWGWSSYAGPREEQDIIGEAGQADYLLRRLALMSALDYDRIFLFALSDLDRRASARDRRYGLLDLAGRPKPAYLALQRFLAMSGPRLLPADPPRPAAAADGLYSIAWRKPGGSRLWWFWGENPGEAVLHGIARATLLQPLSGTSRELKAGPGGLRVPVAPQLQMLEWRP